MYGYSTLLPYLPALFHDLYILAGGWVYIEPQLKRDNTMLSNTA